MKVVRGILIVLVLGLVFLTWRYRDWDMTMSPTQDGSTISILLGLETTFMPDQSPRWAALASGDGVQPLGILAAAATH